MSTYEDRRQLLGRLREAGFDEVDVQLTPSNHDFVVSLDAMNRLFGQPLDPSSEFCRCGHTRHWHGQDIGELPGSGECESNCGCRQFSARPS